MFDRYEVDGLFDEMFETPRKPRQHYAAVAEKLKAVGPAAFNRRVRMADVTFRNQGITFTVYNDAARRREDLSLRPRPPHRPRPRVGHDRSAASSSASPR